VKTLALTIAVCFALYGAVIPAIKNIEANKAQTESYYASVK
jgi:hypothetical protein